MQKQPHFKIEGYEIANNEITVMLEKYSIAIPVIIPQDKFEFWLRTEDKLQWQLVTADHTGQPQEFNGTMSLDEYWNTGDQYITPDLYQYIITNPINRDGVVYSNSVESLNLAFDLHNAQRINPVFNTRWEHEQDVPEFISHTTTKK